MISNYGLHIKERDNRDIIETEYGFLTYTIFEEECFVHDVFVREEFRKTGCVRKLADKITEIAIENKCTYLAGKVRMNDPHRDAILLHNMKWGFTLHSLEANAIVLVKSLVIKKDLDKEI